MLFYIITVCIFFSISKIIPGLHDTIYYMCFHFDCIYQMLIFLKSACVTKSICRFNVGIFFPQNQISEESYDLRIVEVR